MSAQLLLAFSCENSNSVSSDTQPKKTMPDFDYQLELFAEWFGEWVYIPELQQ